MGCDAHMLCCGLFMGSVGKASSRLHDIQPDEKVSFQYLYFPNAGLIQEKAVNMI